MTNNEIKIGEFIVNKDRCSVTKGSDSQILEPKVIDVLLVLYQQKGEVVSQQSIFDHVWPESVFNPSSVQRCIALLRKALHDDAKSPQFILTHPKRGYSLELPQAQQKRSLTSSKSLLFGTVCLMLISAFFLLSNDKIKTDFDRLMPVTSSEAQEQALSLSPDGQFLAFVKGTDYQKHIWLRHLESGVDQQLTTTPDRYGSISWSTDGSAISYFVPYEGQLELFYLPLDALNKSPGTAKSVAVFPSIKIRSTAKRWSAEKQLYFVTRNGDAHSELVSFNFLTQQTSTLKKYSNKAQITEVALSTNDTQLAIALDVRQNRYQIKTFDLNSGESATLTTIDDQIHGLHWHPTGAGVLVSNREKLLLVTRDGTTEQIDFENYDYIVDAQFSQDGEQIFMELRQVDIDIVENNSPENSQFKTLVDTRSTDFLSIYSPDASRFVFQSHRSGLKQLFVYENGRQKLIFKNPDNLELFGIVWSPDGKEIMTASKNSLFRINVDTLELKAIPHDYHPFFLRDWFHHENALLVSFAGDNGFIPAKFNLDKRQLTRFDDHAENYQCLSMGLDENDSIYFSDKQAIYRVNQQQQVEKALQLNNADINGFFATETFLSVKVDYPGHYEIKNFHFDGREEIKLTGSHAEPYKIMNSSADGSKFLYVTKPRKYHTLVKLL